MMKLTFLGTGTSCGVPTIGCECYTCRSTDPHDKRLRCSVLLETPQTRLLIDCGPDFRQQIMTQPFRRIDGILITHAHYDHMGGMDDIRPYCQFGEINVYADPIARKGMLEMLPYCFAEHRYPGVPAIQLHEIHPHHPFTIGDFDIMPFQVMHHDLPILGYRIGPLAYITDMKTMPQASYDALQGLDVLIMNALHVREHPTHQNVDQAIENALRIGAKETYFIHMSHYAGLHAVADAQLPPHIHYAYDGLELFFNFF